MGFTRKILHKKKVENFTKFYSKSLRVDISESFHLHYRNLRIEFSLKEWIIFGKSIFSAWLKWKLIGSPYLRPENKIIHLANENSLPEEIGDREKTSRANELSVELQEATDYLHIHYRGTRLELSIDEFNEYSKALHLASDNLSKSYDLSKIPRRIGINHKTQPENRVSNINNYYQFDLGNSYTPHDFDKDHKSKILLNNVWSDQFDFDINKIYKKPKKIYLINIVLLMVWHFIIQSILRKKSRINREYLNLLKEIIFSK